MSRQIKLIKPDDELTHGSNQRYRHDCPETLPGDICSTQMQPPRFLRQSSASTREQDIASGFAKDYCVQYARAGTQDALELPDQQSKLSPKERGSRHTPMKSPSPLRYSRILRPPTTAHGQPISSLGQQGVTLTWPAKIIRAKRFIAIPLSSA
jgi:hypothetical protein